jgi:Fuc2NAc and GlcNAc transferase
MEAIFVSIAAYLIFGDTILLLIGLSTLGFLPYNWQRASIFMGDVGSIFIGFIFGIFILYFSHDIGDFIIWILILGVFIADATYTLIKRLLNRENILHAHKKHIYQKVVQAGLSHQVVVLLALAINVCMFILIGLFR